MKEGERRGDRGRRWVRKGEERKNQKGGKGANKKEEGMRRRNEEWTKN